MLFVGVVGVFVNGRWRDVEHNVDGYVKRKKACMELA